MSESDGEQAARSLALEQAYVHEVYEQCADRTVQGRHWPRIYQFLEELEPGALVCDIGCGNGKYLDVNHNVFKIGVDRCQRFTNIARDKENEVLTSDNLALPFRDESFDAVLSIAVVHHFSTTERRVRAIKELARVLRIGGRLIISVWAMEQKHRKFESQDVLVPWPKAYCISSTGSPMKPRDISYDERQRGKSAQTYLLSKRSSSQRKGSKTKSYWIDPIFSPSPSTSSLSSPNETCYSFFRRALQKLAGGRRSSRAWFLENWQNGKERRYDQDNEDDGDVDDLPIELRRLEDNAPQLGLTGPRTPKHGDGDGSNGSGPHSRTRLQQQPSDSLSVKSKSLSSIVEVQRLDLVRSRSSIPDLCQGAEEPPEAAAPRQQQQQQPPLVEAACAQSCAPAEQPPQPAKPRLVKQKTHFVDDACLDVPRDNTAIQQLLKDVPELQVAASGAAKRGNVQKQSSMNEELMSIERLKERESVRRNIMKQASLNEELIYKSRPTFEAFKDTFYSGNATKRFQLLKSGLTNRIKQSTTNIEKVSGMSIKNGFVRIFQSWKSTETPPTPPPPPGASPQQPPLAKVEPIERRHSREDGSDSSKDSSLQSDTSVDSEDSFASVIYVPKKNSSPLIEAAIGPGPPAGYQLNTTSAPPSPRVKYAPDPHRLKLMSVSPLLKQFPATSKSLPPPSPPGLSPRTLNSATMRPFFAGNEEPAAAQAGQQRSLLERIAEVKRSFDVQPLPRMPSFKPAAPLTAPLIAEPEPAAGKGEQLPLPATSPPPPPEEDSPPTRRPSLQAVRGYQSMSGTVDADDGEANEEANEEDTSPLITDAIDEALEQLSEKSLSSSDSTGTTTTTTTTTEDEESRLSRLDQIKELLRQKPGFATRAKPSFPLVRRASTATSGRLETVTKVLPRLLSLELFNPETDDLDSDSSGVSSPESVGSVISVISDERFVSKKDAGSKSDSKSDSSGDATDSSKDMASMSCSTKPDDLSSAGEAELSQKSTDDSDSLVELSVGEGHEQKAASKTSPPADAQAATAPTARAAALDKRISPVESTWNEECKRQLIDLTDRLSENLINDIDQFCRRSQLELAEESAALAPTRSPRQGSFELDNNPTEAESRLLLQRSCSDEDSSSTGFVVVSSSGEFLSERELQRSMRRRFGNSIESSDIGDSIENTISSSGSSSQPEARRFCSGSTASLASSGLTTGSRVRLCAQNRSASEEITSTRLQRQQQQQQQQRQSSQPQQREQAQQRGPPRRSATSVSNGTLSGSSSQESLPSDQITYHQYYHVFREGELDQLINKYVENLHIISSYYDHASWCIVAEKVQVWTI